MPYPIAPIDDLDGALKEVSQLTRHLILAHEAAQQLSDLKEKTTIISSLHEALNNSERILILVREAKSKQSSQF